MLLVIAYIIIVEIFTVLLDINLLFLVNFELLIVLFLTQLRRETVNQNKASYVFNNKRFIP